MRKQIGHIPQLNGLRGCAACLVFVHHLFQGYATRPVTGGLLWYTGQGHLGVDAFFVLSGFLITSILLEHREGPNYFHNFYWKRVLRIQPVLWLHLGTTALFAWTGILTQSCLGYVVLSFLFIVNFGSSRFGRLADRFGGPAWTLSIEEQFYLLWPLAVRRLRPKHIYRLAIFLAAASVLLRFVMAAYRGGRGPALYLLPLRWAESWSAACPAMRGL